LAATDHDSRFRLWLEEHAGLLFKVVRSFADGPSDADDLLQEILLQVWLSLPSFRAESKATTWLYRVALNTALAWKRRENKYRLRHRAMTVVAGIADSRPGPDAPDADREAIDRLYAAIRALEPTDRALILLYLDQLSYGEMAEVVGISESNVGVRLNRIKKKLAERLKVTSDVA
jgi:RNA polymerase sigma-70 factor (ECF subfamily)